MVYPNLADVGPRRVGQASLASLGPGPRRLDKFISGRPRSDFTRLARAGAARPGQSQASESLALSGFTYLGADRDSRRRAKRVTESAL